MAIGGTISIRFAWPLIAAAQAEGIAVADLAHRFALREPAEDAIDQRIGAPAYLELWHALVARAGREFPLRAAQQFQPDFALGFACMTSRSLRDAMLCFLRYVPLWSDVITWRLHEDEEHVVLTAQRASVPHPALAYADEYNVASLVVTGRRFVGYRFCPTEVRFVHEPAALAALRAFFGAPVVGGRAEVQLVLPSDVARRPLQLSEPSLAAFFEKKLTELAQAHAATGDLVRVLERLLRAELSNGPPSLPAVAARLGTSERSLRRALARSETSFERLLDGVRRDAATQLVVTTNLRFEEIAPLAGFAEPTALYRAFRRWTGTTPRRYRAEQAR